jgi:hypothetical protein
MDDGWCSNPNPLKKNDFLRLAILRKTLKIEPGSGVSRIWVFYSRFGDSELKTPYR